MPHLDAPAVLHLLALLQTQGFTGDLGGLQAMLVEAERDTSDRHLLSVWGAAGDLKHDVVARILAHARKHELWRHPGQKNLEHISFWSVRAGPATRLGSVEFSNDEIRLVFFRNNDCMGYLRVSWRGVRLDRVRSDL